MEQDKEKVGEENVDRTQDSLNFNEVLHLLSKKAVLGRGIPEKYNIPPWRLPDTQPHREEINSLLQHSMMAQAAQIPKSGDFEDFVLSNASLAVSGLLRHYLSVLGVSADIVFGVLLWDESARSGADDYEGTPHVWLSIAGLPVDNNHVAFPTSADNAEYFFECKKLNAYAAEDPLKTKLKLFLGLEDDEDSKEVVRHNLRVLQTFSQPAHILKYLAVSLKHAELNPGVKMYHLLMQDWVKTRWGKAAPNIEEELKTCTDCKVARYCNRDCQKQEWRVHKLLHKEIEHTKDILDKNANETEEHDEEIVF
eukprot:TRINITY_DN36982_c0_g1_i1.p1 TRINITY_DN36982_c0_g1~~TRINITY_DN36982_c0_g1_i1.p1  ORF type:complete len:322 (-),score=122.70 TRINITY_DN36982_c0_g1_i1:55-981(-)